MSFRLMRQKAGLSVADVMEALSVSDAAVYQWETGANFPRTSTLMKLAKLYHCTVDELLREEDKE